jgi:hypothetical protein
VVKGEFTSHVSLSESSLKLPPSESESFKISLFLSVQIKFLWSTFWTRTRSGIFHIACEARNTICLVRPHWYFRPACWESGHNDSLCLMVGRSAGIKQRHTLCRTSKQLVVWPFPHENPAYTLTQLAGRWTESLGLHTWRSLIVQTWSLYLQYFF